VLVTGRVQDLDCTLVAARQKLRLRVVNRGGVGGRVDAVEIGIVLFAHEGIQVVVSSQILVEHGVKICNAVGGNVLVEALRI